MKTQNVDAERPTSDSSAWLDADVLAREIITVARRHGVSSLRMTFRPDARKEWHDEMQLDWDGGSRGDNLRFHLQSTAHHYGSI